MIKTRRLPLLAILVAGLLLPWASAIADPIRGQGGDEPDPSFWEETVPGETYESEEETSSDLPADDEMLLQEDAAGAGGGAQGASPAALAGWTVIANEGFEGVWPDAGWYSTSANSGTKRWDNTMGKSFAGYWSAHPGNGISYTSDTYTKMYFSAFSLVDAIDAKFSFLYYLDTERHRDFFSWEYSCDGGASWVSQQKSGVSNWKYVTVSLKPCLGKNHVMVQFTFASNGSISGIGPYVDSVLIQKLQ